MTAEQGIARAQLLRKNGDYDAARHVLAGLQELWPESASIRVLHGDTLAKLGCIEEAESELAHAVELEPASETASLSLFHLLWERGKKVEALEEMKRYTHDYESDEYKDILKGLRSSFRT